VGSGTAPIFLHYAGVRKTLSGGGIASGPVSFMKGFRCFWRVSSRAAAKRVARQDVILNVDHPDIV